MKMHHAYLPTISPRKKKKEPEDPYRKNAHKKTEYHYINCPTCDKVVTYKERFEDYNIVCPWCKHFFTPAFDMKPRAIPFWITQSPTDWDEI